MLAPVHDLLITLSFVTVAAAGPETAVVGLKFYVFTSVASLPDASAVVLRDYSKIDAWKVFPIVLKCNIWLLQGTIQ